MQCLRFRYFRGANDDVSGGADDCFDYCDDILLACPHCLAQLKHQSNGGRSFRSVAKPKFHPVFILVKGDLQYVHGQRNWELYKPVDDEDVASEA